MGKWSFRHTEKPHKKVWRLILVCAKKLEHRLIKENTYEKCLPVWLKLEITYISLVAGDYCVKFESLLHVLRKLF